MTKKKIPVNFPPQVNLYLVINGSCSQENIKGAICKQNINEHYLLNMETAGMYCIWHAKQPDPSFSSFTVVIMKYIFSLEVIDLDYILSSSFF